MQLHKDEPFAILGVNTDTDRDLYRREYAEFGMTWPSIFDGDPDGTRGPVTQSWGVSYFPTVYVLDAKGVIRAKGTRGPALDAIVAELLAELKAEREAPTPR